MICKACLSKSPPPLSPMAAEQLIETKGGFNQAVQTPWVYFYDDQEQEIHQDYQGGVLTAICCCGLTIYDYMENGTWQIPQSEDSRT